METKHTAGPWNTGKPAPDIKAPATVREDDGYGWDIAHCFGPRAKDNARLIAAAPDLLAALLECVTEPGATCRARDSAALYRARLSEINAIARQAISKAQG